MVNKYKRTSVRQSWSEGDMQQAIEAINNKAMGWLKASKTFNVPKATLRRRVNGTNKVFKNQMKGLGSIQPSLPPDAENELVNHILELESR